MRTSWIVLRRRATNGSERASPRLACVGPFRAISWVVAALLFLAVTACAPREPFSFRSSWAPPSKCPDAAACAEVLCGPTVAPGDLWYAATRIRRSREIPKETLDRLVACTGAELDAPQGGGLPYTSSCSPAPEDSPETFSSTTPFAAQYPIQEHGLLAGNDCLRRLHFLLVAAEGWSGAPEGREVLVRASTHPDAWTARLARRALVAARDSDAMAARAHDLTSGSSRVLLWSMLDLALARDAARAHVPAIIAAADRAGNAATKYVLPFVLGEIGGEEASTRLPGNSDAWSTISRLPPSMCGPSSLRWRCWRMTPHQPPTL